LDKEHKRFLNRGARLISSESPGQHPVSVERAKLDQFSEEFALLVERYVPSFGNRPSEWLSRLPTEVFRYYNHGIASFGRTPTTDSEKRGRLYLLHTALVLLWMRWGREGARERLETSAREMVRRAALLTGLEHYRREEILTGYESKGWFRLSTHQWVVRIRSASVDTSNISDPSLKVRFQHQPMVSIVVDTLSELSTNGSIPRRMDLPA
jgi:hypothetical protein